MTRHRMRVAGIAAALMLVLTGCAGSGEPISSADPGGSPSVVPPTAPAPSPSAQPTLVSDAIDLPEACAPLFDEAFIADMSEAALPLDDPGLTMDSTLLPSGLEYLQTEPSLRCTWGMPSDVGMATTITLLPVSEHGVILADAAANGFTCESVSATERRCVLRVAEEDPEFGAYAYGEEHVLRGNAWIATHWLNIELPDYTDDLVAALWE